MTARGRWWPLGAAGEAVLDDDDRTRRADQLLFVIPAGEWFRRPTGVPADDIGAVLRAWRASAGRSQAEAAGLLGRTQQNLSQIENGRQTMSYELRQRAVSVFGISAEDLGLSLGRPRAELDAAVSIDQARWRQERRWLNQHRSELARLAVELYLAEHRVPDTPLIAGNGWIPDEPAELWSLRLALDEQPHTVAIDGCEAETLPTRPLCAPGQWFDSYTSPTGITLRVSLDRRRSPGRTGHYEEMPSD